MNWKSDGYWHKKVHLFWSWILYHDYFARNSGVACTDHVQKRRHDCHLWRQCTGDLEHLNNLLNNTNVDKQLPKKFNPPLCPSHFKDIFWQLNWNIIVEFLSCDKKSIALPKIHIHMRLQLWEIHNKCSFTIHIDRRQQRSSWRIGWLLSLHSRSLELSMRFQFHLSEEIMYINV